MKCYKDIFENYLSSKNLKLTNQRLVILNSIFDLHEHFTVESLYEYISLEVKDRVSEAKDVSIPTIYRTIPMLIDCGFIKVVGFLDDKVAYEHTYGHPQHIHLTCSKCKKVIEDDETRKLYLRIKKITDKYNFWFDDYNLSIKGECCECRKKKIKS